MDFKSLRYPLKVAEHQSISKAAAELNISQPSLSKYIKKLSENLGIELLEWKGQKVVLTYAGKTYICWAKKILPLTEKLNTVNLNTSKSAIKIACPMGEGNYINPFVIRQFWELYPDVRIELIDGTAPEDTVILGQCDFAIVNRTVGNKELDSQFIANDEVILVTSAMHPVKDYAVWKEYCRFPRIDVGLLSNETLIEVSSEYRSFQMSREFLKEQNVSLKPMVSVDSIYQAVRIAAAGDAVCFVPERAIRNYKFPEGIARYSIGDPLTMDIFIVHKRDEQLSQYAELFISLMKDFLS